MWWNGKSPLECKWKAVEAETIIRSEFPNGGKATLEKILAPEEIDKPKRAGMWESQWGIQVVKLTVWVKTFEVEKL